MPTDLATLRTLAQETIEGDHDSFLVLCDALEDDSDPRWESLCRDEVDISHPSEERSTSATDAKLVSTLLELAGWTRSSFYTGDVLKGPGGLWAKFSRDFTAQTFELRVDGTGARIYTFNDKLLSYESPTVGAAASADGSRDLYVSERGLRQPVYRVGFAPSSDEIVSAQARMGAAEAPEEFVDRIRDLPSKIREALARTKDFLDRLRQGTGRQIRG